MNIHALSHIFASNNSVSISHAKLIVSASIPYIYMYSVSTIICIKSYVYIRIIINNIYVLIKYI